MPISWYTMEKLSAFLSAIGRWVLSKWVPFLLQLAETSQLQIMAQNCHQLDHDPPMDPRRQKEATIRYFFYCSLLLLFMPGSFTKPGACYFNYKTQLVSSRNLTTSTPHNYPVLRWQIKRRCAPFLLGCWGNPHSGPRTYTASPLPFEASP